MCESSLKEGYYPYAIFFDRKDMFGNYYGCFNEERVDPQAAEDEILQQWQGGYHISHNDIIEKSYACLNSNSY